MLIPGGFQSEMRLRTEKLCTMSEAIMVAERRVTYRTEHVVLMTVFFLGLSWNLQKWTLDRIDCVFVVCSFYFICEGISNLFIGCQRLRWAHEPTLGSGEENFGETAGKGLPGSHYPFLCWTLTSIELALLSTFTFYLSVAAETLKNLKWHVTPHFSAKAD